MPDVTPNNVDGVQPSSLNPVMAGEDEGLEVKFHGDRPITEEQSDQFGFAKLAERIAQSLTAQAAGKGFVLGVEGKWGSGKSSLLALTMGALRKMDTARVSAVEFRPWLIGDRDQLLSALFEDLAKAIANIEHARGDATDNTLLAASNVADQFKSYARHLTPIGKLTSAVGLLVPGANIIGELMKAVGDAASERGEGPTLVEQKDKLSDALLKLDCRIVVAIDDVDRLEPREVAELLRLVRSVADFPNISYILCYDAHILGSAIQSAMGVSDGIAYLEKIVQTEVAVPRPESFALRRWFSRELQTFAQCDMDRVPDLQHIIDETGGRAFDTPRKVVRVLDSLRVFWPTLEGRVDLPDLVWLRMIAVASPNLYRWTEEYLVGFAAVAAGRAHITDHSRKRMSKALDKSLKRDALDWKQMQFEIERHLPGIQTFGINEGHEKRIFSQTDRASRLRDSREKRLSSPNFSRLYFTLVEPPESVTELDLAKLLAAAGEGTNPAAHALLEMNKLRGDAGVTKAERLIELLRYVEPEIIHGWPVEYLTFSLVNVADQLAAEATGDDWGYPRVWNDLRAFLKHLKATLPTERFETLLERLFRLSVSIGFLSYLLRQETFNLGIYGDKPDPRDTLTTIEKFSDIRDALFARYRAGGLTEIIRDRWGTNSLYAWSQAGGRKEMLPLVAEYTRADSGLCSFLKKLFRKNSSLSLAGMSNFFDEPATAARRVYALATETPPNDNAKAILDSLEENAQFHGGDLLEIFEAWEKRAQDAAEEPSEQPE